MNDRFTAVEGARERVEIAHVGIHVRIAQIDSYNLVIPGKPRAQARADRAVGTGYRNF